ncbi:YcaO-like family protein [Mycobacterium attenuatum]|uniref:Ribosomal protein S12 methylthiotransferase accessory factor YcaO n=1 Tax=Mycobacterium attenuatum TaxID=2341086 RepID=A0A498PU27_9MYCO|nr:YcaO-like family protein [Mycobacterium attenuatum]VBA35558.1 Ribosomal protein S12 methylthiotransferase accessory factor YcaO [Mycobacterium attenuatum]VBA52377.1 Ribosomal protein S12 methylthiotransferase accessory factor YcaO [Mycobacterium attenuatum]
MSESCAAATTVSVGPDWSQWPTRVLGHADPTSIAHRAGSYRIISPEQTWHAVQPMLELAGITRVADLTWLDDLGIPTVQAVRPASVTLSVSQGKAATYRAAQVSAVMESLETWHAENVTPDLFSMRTTDIAAALTYDPAHLLLSARSIYHPGAKLDWMTATTLMTGRQTWVPWEAVLVNAAVENRWDPPMFSMDTTGLASGNSYWEASLHGLYEVMERHAMAAGEPGSTLFEVPLDDVADSGCAELVDMIYRAGSELKIARTDTWDGFPCFTAEICSPMLGVPFSGFGLHHDPNVALSRAITEAAQSRLTAISGAREDLAPALYHRFARVHAYGPLRPTMLHLPTAEPTPWHVPDTDSLSELLASAATAVAARSGTEPLAVVCDIAGSCVPVVKVIAPGLTASHGSPMRTPLQESA